MATTVPSTISPRTVRVTPIQDVDINDMPLFSSRGGSCDVTQQLDSRSRGSTPAGHSRSNVPPLVGLIANLQGLPLPSSWPSTPVVSPSREHVHTAKSTQKLPPVPSAHELPKSSVLDDVPAVQVAHEGGDPRVPRQIESDAAFTAAVLGATSQVSLSFVGTRLHNRGIDERYHGQLPPESPSPPPLFSSFGSAIAATARGPTLSSPIGASALGSPKVPSPSPSPRQRISTLAQTVALSQNPAPFPIIPAASNSSPGVSPRPPVFMLQMPTPLFKIAVPPVKSSSPRAPPPASAPRRIVAGEAAGFSIPVPTPTAKDAAVAAALSPEHADPLDPWGASSPVPPLCSPGAAGNVSPPPSRTTSAPPPPHTSPDLPASSTPALVLAVPPWNQSDGPPSAPLPQPPPSVSPPCTPPPACGDARAAVVGIAAGPFSPSPLIGDDEGVTAHEEVDTGSSNIACSLADMPWSNRHPGSWAAQAIAEEPQVCTKGVGPPDQRVEDVATVACPQTDPLPRRSPRSRGWHSPRGSTPSSGGESEEDHRAAGPGPLVVPVTGSRGSTSSRIGLGSAAAAPPGPRHSPLLPLDGRRLADPLTSASAPASPRDGSGETKLNGCASELPAAAAAAPPVPPHPARRGPFARSPVPLRMEALVAKQSVVHHRGGLPAFAIADSMALLAAHQHQQRLRAARTSPPPAHVYDVGTEDACPLDTKSAPTSVSPAASSPDRASPPAAAGLESSTLPRGLGAGGPALVTSPATVGLRTFAPAVVPARVVSLDDFAGARCGAPINPHYVCTALPATLAPLAAVGSDGSMAAGTAVGTTRGRPSADLRRDHGRQPYRRVYPMLHRDGSAATERPGGGGGVAGASERQKQKSQGNDNENAFDDSDGGDEAVGVEPADRTQNVACSSSDEEGVRVPCNSEVATARREATGDVLDCVTLTPQPACVTGVVTPPVVAPEQKAVLDSSHSINDATKPFLPLAPTVASSQCPAGSGSGRADGLAAGDGNGGSGSDVSIGGVVANCSTSTARAKQLLETTETDAPPGAPAVECLLHGWCSTASSSTSLNVSLSAVYGDSADDGHTSGFASPSESRLPAIGRGALPRDAKRYFPVPSSGGGGRGGTSVAASVDSSPLCAVLPSYLQQPPRARFAPLSMSFVNGLAPARGARTAVPAGPSRYPLDRVPPLPRCLPRRSAISAAPANVVVLNEPAGHASGGTGCGWRPLDSKGGPGGGGCRGNGGGQIVVADVAGHKGNSILSSSTIGPTAVASTPEMLAGELVLRPLKGRYSLCRSSPAASATAVVGHRSPVAPMAGVFDAYRVKGHATGPRARPRRASGPYPGVLHCRVSLATTLPSPPPLTPTSLHLRRQRARQRACDAGRGEESGEGESDDTDSDTSTSNGQGGREVPRDGVYAQEQQAIGATGSAVPATALPRSVQQHRHPLPPPLSASLRHNHLIRTSSLSDVDAGDSSVGSVGIIDRPVARYSTRHPRGRTAPASPHKDHVGSAGELTGSGGRVSAVHGRSGEDGLPCTSPRLRRRGQSSGLAPRTGTKEEAPPPVAADSSGAQTTPPQYDMEGVLRLVPVTPQSRISPRRSRVAVPPSRLPPLQQPPNQPPTSPSTTQPAPVGPHAARMSPEADISDIVVPAEASPLAPPAPVSSAGLPPATASASLLQLHSTLPAPADGAESGTDVGGDPTAPAPASPRERDGLASPSAFPGGTGTRVVRSSALALAVITPVRTPTPVEPLSASRLLERRGQLPTRSRAPAATGSGTASALASAVAVAVVRGVELPSGAISPPDILPAPQLVGPACGPAPAYHQRMAVIMPQSQEVAASTRARHTGSEGGGCRSSLEPPSSPPGTPFSFGDMLLGPAIGSGVSRAHSQGTTTAGQPARTEALSPTPSPTLSCGERGSAAPGPSRSRLVVSEGCEPPEATPTPLPPRFCAPLPSLRHSMLRIRALLRANIPASASMAQTSLEAGGTPPTPAPSPTCGHSASPQLPLHIGSRIIARSSSSTPPIPSLPF